MPRDSKYYVGAMLPTNRCGDVKIVNMKEEAGIPRYKVRFESGIKRWVSASTLRSGAAFDPTTPTVCGVGYVGIGPYTVSSNKRAAALWRGMLSRVYSGEKRHAAYSDCTVATEWLNFQNFARTIQLLSNWDTPGFHMDKDLRVVGSREYSPATVSFVPGPINSAGIRRTKTNKGLPMGVSIAYMDNPRRKVYTTFKHGPYPELVWFETAVQAGQFFIDDLRRHGKALAAKHRSVLHPEVYANLQNLPKIVMNRTSRGIWAKPKARAKANLWG